MEKGKGPSRALFNKISKLLGWGPTFTQKVGDQQGELMSGAWFVRMLRAASVMVCGLHMKAGGKWVCGGV